MRGLISTCKTGELMARMEEDLGLIFVLAGQYDRDTGDFSYPDECMVDLNGGLIVGAVDRWGYPTDDTPDSDDLDIFAPGEGLPSPGGNAEAPKLGTSYGKSEDEPTFMSWIAKLTHLFLP
jgi:hypothetical protein